MSRIMSCGSCVHIVVYSIAKKNGYNISLFITFSIINYTDNTCVT